MRKLNKLLALTLAMVLGLSVSALADENTGKGYTDVAGHWAEDDIARITELKLIDGKTADTFAPDENMTREAMAVALYRLAGSPANGEDAKNPFTDVADGASYRDAVIWAAANGIVTGSTETTFVPDAYIQRQAIAKMMNLYAAYAVKAEKLTARSDALSSFPDAADVAGWAKDYMNWAVASEFINGSNGKLNPTGTATRAQVAAILCRYLDDASTGDASLDKSRNEDGIGSKELLVVSFGTSFNDSRRLTVGAIEDALEKALPAYSVRRGFTSNIIIEHVARRDGQIIDDVTQALERAKANGVKELLVQPTHLMNGYEYSDLRNELAKYADDFESIKIGAPLLTTDDDFAKVADAMVKATAEFTKDGKTAVCYMGHGTEAASNGIYAKMQQVLTEAGHTNYFVGTVESEPTAQDLVKLVKEAGYENVVLRPMMIVAGDHANNDMADENDPESWYSVFTAAGLNVQADVRGLGELKEVQDLLVAHAKAAVELSDTDVAIDPGKAAPASLADGVYTIEVESSAKMFRVVGCELTVAGGKMTAVLTLSGTGYDKLFAGTKAEAEAAAEGFIPFQEDSEGKYTYTVSVSALDEELPFAAHSAKKDEWYDRGLTFVSATAQAK